jgi:hypothetical protein
MSTTAMQFSRRYRPLTATVAAADQWVAIAYSPVDKQFG